ncbi:hypothetical protein B0J18DRAFT_424929 [Chaetomium sp. MPI-SDFR-AT-0129]|nr:hypothetical protein B0J18DRAFT_424929 [Chaetomium sp. MPI-SDFR-AT-0129]
MVSLRSVFAGAVLLAAPIMAALSATQLADGLNTLTNKLEGIKPDVERITIVNAPLITLGQGPFPVVLGAFAQFTTVHRDVLDILINKAQILTTTSFAGSRVTSVLREAEDNYFNIFTTIVKTYYPVGEQLVMLFRSLDQTLKTTIQTYDGFRVQKRAGAFSA